MQRMTKQRQAVLDELTRVTDFRSAQQIFEDLHVQGQRVRLHRGDRAVSDRVVGNQGRAGSRIHGRRAFPGAVRYLFHVSR